MLQALCSIVALATWSGPGAASAGPLRWTADGERSRLTVRVFKRGLLSALAHDHLFAVTAWRATATFDAAAPSGARVEVVVAADSLRDRQPGLSLEDREKVDRQAAGPDVLDARRHPEIRFVSTALEVAPGSPGADGGIEGKLAGTLSLRDRERPVSASLAATREGKGWRARGAVTFKQSDFGIPPYSGFGGTIAVHDEVRLEYDVFVQPAE